MGLISLKEKKIKIHPNKRTPGGHYEDEDEGGLLVMVEDGFVGWKEGRRGLPGLFVCLFVLCCAVLC